MQFCASSLQKVLHSAKVDVEYDSCRSQSDKATIPNGQCIDIEVEDVHFSRSFANSGHTGSYDQSPSTAPNSIISSQHYDDSQLSRTASLHYDHYKFRREWPH